MPGHVELLRIVNPAVRIQPGVVQTRLIYLVSYNRTNSLSLAGAKYKEGNRVQLDEIGEKGKFRTSRKPKK